MQFFLIWENAASNACVVLDTACHMQNSWLQQSCTLTATIPFGGPSAATAASAAALAGPSERWTVFIAPVLDRLLPNFLRKGMRFVPVQCVVGFA